MKRTVSVKKNSRSSSSSRKLRHLRAARHENYVVCVRNSGYPASLELRKLYRALHDNQAARHKMIRVVDESGEDYLYPASWFKALSLPPAIHRALASAA